MDIKFERWLNLDEGDVMEALEEVVRSLMEGKGSPSPPGLNSASQQHFVLREEAVSIANEVDDHIETTDYDDTN